MPTPPTLEFATDVKTRIEEEILTHPFVSGIDVGYRPGSAGAATDVVIRVYVTDTEQAAALPKDADGVQIVVIERRFSPH